MQSCSVFILVVWYVFFTFLLCDRGASGFFYLLLSTWVIMKRTQYWIVISDEGSFSVFLFVLMLKGK